jgi:hypothetical protein
MIWLLLLSRCLASIGDEHTNTQTNARDFMKHVVLIDSGAVICVYTPSLIKIGSGIQKLLGGGTQRWGSHKPTFIFQNIENRLKLLSFGM